ncbi:MAG TPA: hypothetical protein VJ376_16755, partial [Pseudomonadota bacterium]|nr:hypothetical protein [Pseudomonadota bacterium]
EHQIPDAEHGLLGNELKRLFEIEHQVRTLQPYCRSGDSPLSRGLLPYGGFPRIESDFSRLKSYSTEELNSTSWRLRRGGFPICTALLTKSLEGCRTFTHRFHYGNLSARRFIGSSIAPRCSSMPLMAPITVVFLKLSR